MLNLDELLTQVVIWRSDQKSDAATLFPRHTHSASSINCLMLDGEWSGCFRRSLMAWVGTPRLYRDAERDRIMEEIRFSRGIGIEDFIKDMLRDLPTVTFQNIKDLTRQYRRFTMNVEGLKYPITGEVDFVLQKGHEVIPIECKSTTSGYAWQVFSTKYAGKKGRRPLIFQLTQAAVYLMTLSRQLKDTKYTCPGAIMYYVDITEAYPPVEFHLKLSDTKEVLVCDIARKPDVWTPSGVTWEGVLEGAKKAESFAKDLDMQPKTYENIFVLMKKLSPMLPDVPFKPLFKTKDLNQLYQNLLAKRKPALTQEQAKLFEKGKLTDIQESDNPLGDAECMRCPFRFVCLEKERPTITGGTQSA